MDPSAKKRKTEENGTTTTNPTPLTTTTPTTTLTPEDLTKILQPFTHDQLIKIITTTALTTPSVLNAVRSMADNDVSQRKLFIRGLGWDTTTENIRSLFAGYGELLEAIVVVDKATGKSKGYGFITYKHIDGAVLALKEPSKKIDGRVTVTQLASAGNLGAGAAGGGNVNVGVGNGNGGVVDGGVRKVYVANVPFDMKAERITEFFSVYGEIAEGPFGFDKMTGKCKGYALVVFKSSESARAALVEPNKVIDGQQVVCRFANENKKGKEMGGNGEVNVGGGNAVSAGGMGGGGGGLGLGAGQYGLGGGLGLGGYSSYGQQPHQGLMSHGYLGSSGSQLPSALSGLGSAMGSGLGSGSGGPMMPSAYGGGGGGLGGLPSSYGGLGDGIGSSLYNRMPPSSVGYPESGYLGLSSSTYPGGPGHLQHSAGGPGGSRIPTGGMYHGVPPYY